MFDCPNCEGKTYKLVASGTGVKCPQCYSIPKRINCNLHQILGAGKARRTVGKDWEIGQRVTAEDGVTVINKTTGKETEY